LHGLQISGGIDFKQLGDTQTDRVSEIKWDYREQRWFIQFRRGPLARRKLRKAHLKAYGVVSARAEQDSSPVAYYREYQEAVADEVDVVNAAAARGERWIECPKPSPIRRLVDALARRWRR
jgi:hypothetical protein